MRSILIHIGHLLALVTFVTSNEWHLEVYTKSRCVFEEKDATINCFNVTDDNAVSYAYDIEWIKLILDSELSDSVLDFVTIPKWPARVWSDGHQLRLTSAISSDEGRYCCRSLQGSQNHLHYGCTGASAVNLSIVMYPELAPVHNVYVTTALGIGALLECNIKFIGKPAASLFMWQKFGVNIDEGTKYTIKMSNSTFILIIRNVTEDDKGIYSCVISNPEKYIQANKSVLLSPRSNSNGKNTIIMIMIY